MRRKYAELSQIADVIGGYTPKPSECLREGSYMLLTGRNLDDTGLKLGETDEYINRSPTPSFERAILREGDIVLAILFENRKLYIYRKLKRG